LERKRFVAILVLFIASCMFWAAFEQAGSTMSLFAEHSTHKSILGFEYPASWFQSLNALFIIIFAPVFAWLWIKLGRRDPSSPTKFALGLLLIGLGFVVLIPAAFLARNGQVSALWLTAAYLFHTFGELALSPVGLSAMTKLAPQRVASLMMGAWFMTISVGEYVGGRLAGLYASMSTPVLFGVVAAFSIGTAIILFFLVKPTIRLMSGVK
jgi:POT family proton-dependent oligopeptide transporter